METQHEEVIIRTSIRAGDDGGLGMGSGNFTGGMMGGGGATAPDGGGTYGSGH
jgi:hypothetical protein